MIVEMENMVCDACGEKKSGEFVLTEIGNVFCKDCVLEFDPQLFDKESG